jgi:hypothetical protein
LSISHGFIYLIKSSIDGITYYKIGKTKRSPLKRLKELNTGNQADLKIVDTFECDYYHTVENMLHKHFNRLRTSGEWFEEEKDNLCINSNIFKTLCKEKVDLIKFMSENNEHFLKTLK